MKNKFVEIPHNILLQIHSQFDYTFRFYYSKNVLLRKIFWLRLRVIWGILIRVRNCRFNSCLDFGGGGGVFLPTLAVVFNEVYSADFEIEEAKRVASFFKIKNIVLKGGDILTANFDSKRFDVIIAADVLEHFIELADVVGLLDTLLEDKGILVTSLPSENWLYALVRKIFGLKKPFDHYNSAKEIELYLSSIGFISLRSMYPNILWPFFSITAWRRSTFLEKVSVALPT